MAPGDVVRRMLEESGLSVLDLLATTVEIARRDYPMELVRCRDQIVESLYRGVQCLECDRMGREQLSHTLGFVAETKTPTTFSDSPQPQVVVEISSQMPERRRPLRVVIPLRKKKNSILEVTERSKSESHETEAIQGSLTDSNEMNQFQKNELKKEDFTDNNFEKAKRKLQESYEMAACAKKQRCVKVLSINELPKQGICRPQHKSVKHAASRAAPRIQSKCRNLVEISTNEKITSKYRSAGGLLSWEE